jgi:hypothetical protein
VAQEIRSKRKIYKTPTACLAVGIVVGLIGTTTNGGGGIEKGEI